MNQKEKSELSKQGIITSAIKTFSTYGYDQTSLNRICNENHISKGRFYHYFENKDALLLSCVQWCFDKVDELNLAIDFDLCPDLGAKLRAIFHARQQLFLTNPYSVPFMSIMIHTPPEHLKAEILSLRHSLQSQQKTMIERIYKEYGAPQVDVDLYVEIFDAASYRAHLLNQPKWNPGDSKENLERNVEESEKIFDKLIHIFLYGILSK